MPNLKKYYLMHFFLFVKQLIFKHGAQTFASPSFFLFHLARCSIVVLGVWFTNRVAASADIKKQYDKNTFITLLMQ